MVRLDVDPVKLSDCKKNKTKTILVRQGRWSIDHMFVYKYDDVFGLY